MHDKSKFKYTTEDCVFCGIVMDGKFDDFYSYFVSFKPLNPVTKGHILVIPTFHTPNINEISDGRMLDFEDLSYALKYFTRDIKEYNLITSKGSNATQTIQHLHFHIVPRTKDDGLKLPWTDQLATPKKESK